MKLDPGPMDLPVQALIGAIITSPDGVELGAVEDVRISIHSGDKVEFLLRLDGDVGILWSDREDYRIKFQGP
jgi:sporulation protein YlmC with PRC-barrel domain